MPSRLFARVELSYEQVQAKLDLDLYYPFTENDNILIYKSILIIGPVDSIFSPSLVRFILEPWCERNHQTALLMQSFNGSGKLKNQKFLLQKVKECRERILNQGFQVYPSYEKLLKF